MRIREGLGLDEPKIFYRGERVICIRPFDEEWHALGIKPGGCYTVSNYSNGFLYLKETSRFIGFASANFKLMS